ncbi:hypothetical protein GGR16_002196 [Chelatococcus caeni]|uniref:FHA domain-containing protein n=1 Tax=Chelatococcus caeni TaxID=1348468 RepID=A0A840C429_9HYPH|nr:FHA domain-containing protein [Chelatococcus caeni]MBB4017167.1 hypothetical protein [Chelatococcus caeni]
MQLRTATSSGRANVIDAGRAVATRLVAGGGKPQEMAGQPPAGPALAVVSGCHAGASFQLLDKVYRIGSTAEADIVLADPGIAPDHATIRIGRGSMKVEARGGDVDVAGHGLLPGGYGRLVRLPAEITLGGATLRITDDRMPPLPRAVHLARRAARRPLPVAGLALGLILALSLPVILMERGRGAGADAAGQAAGTAPQMRPTTHEAAEQLKSRIAAADLAGLQVTAVDDSRIVVAGVVPERKMPAWTETRSWFDATYAQNPLLVSQVTASDSFPIQGLRLRAVWFGDTPYVVTGDGRKHHEGAVIEGGWRVERIDREAVTFARDGNVVRLTY